ncbi:MAG: metallophosphoesterase family protein [Chloroflexia bacterium]
MILGVLSDTHGTLHPQVLPLFREAGVERILHAGDVGAYFVIEQLSTVAPVSAVVGNVDLEGSVASLPHEVRLEIEGVSIYMTHVGGKPGVWLPRLPRPLPDVAICGHSHAPLLEQVGPTLFLNPGAAGTRARFRLPLSAALLRIESGAAEAKLVTLQEH